MIKYKDLWRMPPILDDPGKLIIMAGENNFFFFTFFSHFHSVLSIKLYEYLFFSLIK